MDSSGRVQKDHRARLPKRISAPVLLVAIALAVYGNTIANGFVWDDRDIIVENPANRDLSSVPSLFTSVDATRTASHQAYYRPLTRLTYVLDYQLFRLEPGWYHAENVLLHAATVLALYFLVRALFGSSLGAFGAALLLAIHPANAEAVDFLSTRNTILATLFVIVALAMHHRARTGGSRAAAVASWGAFLASLLCKETGAMLLAMLPVYDLPSPGALRDALRERAMRWLPFAAVFCFYFALRASAIPGGVGAELDLPHLGERLARVAYLVPSYARIVLFPARLSAYYLIPPDWTASWPWLVAAWCGIAAAVVLLLRLRSAAIAFGLLWLALNLVPVLGIIPLPSAAMAERYLYLPAIGIWIIAGDLLRKAWEHERARRALAVAFPVVVAVLSVATARRNVVWRDPITFYSAMVAAESNAVLARYSLGLAQLDAGNVAATKREWQAAAALDPYYFEVAARLGTLYAQEGDMVEAERWLDLGVAADTVSATTLYNAARVKARLGKSAEAAAFHERSLRAAAPTPGR